MWTMDTFLNQQTGYFFEMNPSGLMADALKGPTGTNNREWDGIWNARARQSEIGWVLEIDIPFRTLAFDPNAPAWGINFQRTVRRKNEELLWTGHQRNQGLQRMANAGLLLGLQEVTQGLGLELKPVRRRPRQRRTRAGAGGGARHVGRRRHRRDLQLHAEPARRRHDQHRLRRDRGRSAPGQPDPLPAVLSREADVLPRRRDLLRLLLAVGVLLAPHRPRRRRPAAAHRRRHQGHRPGRTAGRRPALRAHRRGHDRAGRGLHRRPHAPAHPAAVVHRRHLHRAAHPRPGRPRHAAHRRPRLPAADGDVPRQQEPGRGRLRAVELVAARPADHRLGRQHRVPERHLGIGIRLRIGAARPQPGGRLHAAQRLQASTCPS